MTIAERKPGHPMGWGHMSKDRRGMLAKTLLMSNPTTVRLMATAFQRERCYVAAMKLRARACFLEMRQDRVLRSGRIYTEADALADDIREGIREGIRKGTALRDSRPGQSRANRLLAILTDAIDETKWNETGMAARVQEAIDVLNEPLPHGLKIPAIPPLDVRAKSHRNIPLIECEFHDGTTLTVEMWPKWYSLFLVDRTGTGTADVGVFVTPLEYHDLRESECYRDHLPNPTAVWAWLLRHPTVHVDPLAWECIVGRWIDEGYDCDWNREEVGPR